MRVLFCISYFLLLYCIVYSFNSIIGYYNTLSFDCCDEEIIVIGAQSWVSWQSLHLGVNTGEFWGTEFSPESILKSTMNYIICGSHHSHFSMCILIVSFIVKYIKYIALCMFCSLKKYICRVTSC